MLKETQRRRIFIMAKRTTSAAHERMDDMQVEVAEIKTEIRIQFKDLYNKIKRLEAIMIALTGASLLLLLNITFLGG
ncbi:MAG TPA: hypothetical protein DCL39_10170 [Alteromonas macleodii]|nr:hypothetical protein [Alteromonas macleodii]|tara:strand:- start:685 stop:915 length:231 start_codon:yes stop_codon:yes gene_type:complete